MTRYSNAKREEELSWFRDNLKPGDTVYTVLDHVSSSGMSRNIRLVIIKCKNGKPYLMHPNYAAQVVLGYSQAKKGDGFRVGGAGMDMGFHVVYQLGQAIWPNGTPTPHGTRNGKPDSDGGYALNHQWL